MNVMVPGLILILVVFFPCLFFKIHSKISVALGLMFFILAAVIFISGHSDTADDLATAGFFLLVASVALVVVENIGDIRREQRPGDDEGQ